MTGLLLIRIIKQPLAQPAQVDLGIESHHQCPASQTRPGLRDTESQLIKAVTVSMAKRPAPVKPAFGAQVATGLLTHEADTTSVTGDAHRHDEPYGNEDLPFHEKADPMAGGPKVPV